MFGYNFYIYCKGGPKDEDLFGGACGGVKPLVVAKMMWKAYIQLQNPPSRIDRDYANATKLIPETDFRMKDGF